VPRYYVFLPSIELRVKLLEDDEVLEPELEL
jgi:hypothetical protein